MKYALMDNEGQLLEKGKRPSADNLDDFVAALYEVGDQYKGKFAGIGVCAPREDRHGENDHPLWRGFDLFGRLESERDAGR